MMKVAEEQILEVSVINFKKLTFPNDFPQF
jgi:hypothetical protein